MKKIRAVVIGYGDRGATYARYAKSNPEALEISAVADPIQNRRDFAREQFPLSENQVYDSWEKLAEQPKLADFAIIATQDHQHLEPALAMIDKGNHLLLEKPMATTPEECKKITEAAEKKACKSLFATFYGLLNSG